MSNQEISDWTKEEDALLMSLIRREYPSGVSQIRSWNSFADLMDKEATLDGIITARNYTGFGLLLHYDTFLKPQYENEESQIISPQATSWTNEEDELLLSLIHFEYPGGRCQVEQSWVMIASIMSEIGAAAGSGRHYTADLVMLHYDNYLRPLYAMDSQEDVFLPPTLPGTDWAGWEDDLLLSLLHTDHLGGRSHTRRTWGEVVQLMTERASAARITERTYSIPCLKNRYYRRLRPRYRLGAASAAHNTLASSSDGGVASSFEEFDGEDA